MNLDKLWHAILDAVLEERASGDAWKSGYRTGLLDAYSKVTGIRYSVLTSLVLAELKADEPLDAVLRPGAS